MLTVLGRSLVIRGFVNSEFASEYYGQFLREIGHLVVNGQIHYREHIVDGLETAPSAFIGNAGATPLWKATRESVLSRS